jgi:hypothetical protein
MKEVEGLPKKPTPGVMPRICRRRHGQREEGGTSRCSNPKAPSQDERVAIASNAHPSSLSALSRVDTCLVNDPLTEEPDEVKVSRPVCAVRHFEIFLLQTGRTREEFLSYQLTQR